MDFRSDNTAMVHPLVLKAIQEVNNSNESSYGSDQLSKKVRDHFTKLFKQETHFALVATGTAANCIALRTLTPGHGTIITTSEAHLNNDEGQAPELLLGGAKLRTFSTHDHKLDLSAASKWVQKAKAMTPHAGLPSTVSITQANEWGEIYSAQELREIRAFCDQENLKLHVDGARIANALSAQNLSPSEFINICKPDAISFGLTKNSALMAEAVLVFNPQDAKLLSYVQKQTGHLLSKTRFIAAQFEALLNDNLWLELAQHSNEMAQMFAETLKLSDELQIVGSVKTNQVFVRMSDDLAGKLTKNGVLFYPWENDIYRFVFSWMSQPSEIKEFKQTLSRL